MLKWQLSLLTWLQLGHHGISEERAFGLGRKHYAPTSPGKKELMGSLVTQARSHRPALHTHGQAGMSVKLIPRSVKNWHPPEARPSPEYGLTVSASIVNCRLTQAHTKGALVHRDCRRTFGKDSLGGRGMARLRQGPGSAPRCSGRCTRIACNGTPFSQASLHRMEATEHRG